jgi:hypothetical protein
MYCPCFIEFVVGAELARSWHFRVDRPAGPATFPREHGMSAQKWSLGNTITDQPFVDFNANDYMVDTNLVVAQKGWITWWEIFAMNGNPIQLIIYRGDKSQLRVVGKSQMAIPRVGANLFSVTEPIAVEAGDMVGWHCPEGGCMSFYPLSEEWLIGELRGNILFGADPKKGHTMDGSCKRVYSILVRGESQKSQFDAAHVMCSMPDSEGLELIIASIKEVYEVPNLAVVFDPTQVADQSRFGGTVAFTQAFEQVLASLIEDPPDGDRYTASAAILDNWDWVAPESSQVQLQRIIRDHLNRQKLILQNDEEAGMPLHENWNFRLVEGMGDLHWISVDRWGKKQPVHEII